jgi:hypothetical protein
MSRTVCYLQPSLDSVATYDGDELNLWHQPHDEDHPRSIESRALACAEAVAKNQRRPSSVVVGVDHASFRWVSSPTLEASVIATVTRRRLTEDQQGPVTATVQPLDATPAKQSTFLHKLSRTQKQSSPEHRDTHATVLTLEDGPVRLWFDALDQKGIMPRDVMTTWHAMARIWGADITCQMIVCEITANNLVWALCQNGKLLVGGQVQFGDTHATVSRLTLDWLTWCAELGVEIDSIHFVMHDPDTLASQCASRWENVPIEKTRDPEPMKLLLAQLHEQEIPTEQVLDDPRRALTVVTHRSNRVHKRLIRVAALALLLLGIGIGILGVRLYSESKAFRAHSNKLQNQNWAILQRAMFLDDLKLADLRRNSAPDLILESEVLQVQQASAPLEAPPLPVPIYAENSTFLEVFSQQEDLELTAINIDSNRSTVTFTSNAFAPAEALLEALRQTNSTISWTGKSRGQPPSLFWNLDGEWRQ